MQLNQLFFINHIDRTLHNENFVYIQLRNYRSIIADTKIIIIQLELSYETTTIGLQRHLKTTEDSMMMICQRI